MHGKTIIVQDGEALRARARAAERVIVDVGTGDGRSVYRLARANPAWLRIGVDANADRMREASFRASRKPARGGAPNAVFVRAATGCLPHALDGLAHEIRVAYPWGSLLRAIVEPHLEVLRALALLGRPGARFEARINRTAVGASLDSDALLRAYGEAGIDLRATATGHAGASSSWSARLARSGAVETLMLEGYVNGATAKPTRNLRHQISTLR